MFPDNHIYQRYVQSPSLKSVADHLLRKLQFLSTLIYIYTHVYKESPGDTLLKPKSNTKNIFIWYPNVITGFFTTFYVRFVFLKVVSEIVYYQTWEDREYDNKVLPQKN